MDFKKWRIELLLVSLLQLQQAVPVLLATSLPILYEEGFFQTGVYKEKEIKNAWYFKKHQACCFHQTPS